MMVAAARQFPASLLFSMEMTQPEIAARMVANISGVDLASIASRQVKGDDRHHVLGAIDDMQWLPMLIDDQPALTLLRMRFKAREIQQQGNLALQVAVDDEYSSGTRDANLSLCRGLKQAAKELDCAVLVLSRLNSHGILDLAEEPTLEVLDATGLMGADVVLSLQAQSRIADAERLLAGVLVKVRQGPRGRIALRFEERNQQWSEIEVDLPVSRQGEID